MMIPKRAPQRLSRWLALALAGGTLFTGTFVLQNQFLYFPAPATVDTLVSQRLRAWPAAAEFRGLLAEPAGTARGTVLVFHGNAGHAGHREYYAAMLTPLGLRVILAEYPGYGPRPGPLGESSLVGDAERTIERAHESFGAPLLLVGESLGAAVAAAAGARQAGRISGLLLITPWDRLSEIAAYHYPWLPTASILRDRYDSVANLAAFTKPVVVALAERDEIVPERFGLRLYEALPGPKRLQRLHGAGHNDWVGRVDSEWWRRIADFLLSPSGAPP